MSGPINDKLTDDAEDRLERDQKIGDERRQGNK